MEKHNKTQMETLNETPHWSYQSAFHNHWMIRIKNETGASYCSWERTKNKYNLLLKLKDTNGVKRDIRVPVVGSPADVTGATYKDVLKVLTDGQV